jgi:hypothetical protein
MKLLYIRLTLLVWLQIGSVFFMTTAKAQTTSELGFGLGGVNYKGEIAPKYRFGNNKPAITGFYRRDISNAITLKGSILLGFPGARDTAFKLPLNNFRQVEMSGTLIEAAVGFEYNFLDFHDVRRHKRWTPYYFLNIAAYYLSVSTQSSQGAIIPGNPPIPTIRVSDEVTLDNAFFSIAIPTGVGVKYALNHNWNLGLEVGARKIFTDRFDNLSEVVPSKALVNPFDSDWYFFNGITLSYTFYKLNCPKVYKQQPSPLE